MGNPKAGGPPCLVVTILLSNSYDCSHPAMYDVEHCFSIFCCIHVNRLDNGALVPQARLGHRL